MGKLNWELLGEHDTVYGVIYDLHAYVMRSIG